MSSVTLKNISKSFGRVEAVRDISLEIPHGEFVVFVGPSGCGKSTLLRMIAGLEHITGGELQIAERAVNDVPAADRGIAMVFQSYALYPHMNVRENIGFGLKMAGMSATDVARKVDEAATSLQITGLLDRRPRELSGGQRQRVAIGRAIVKEPDVFLFDEPLSNLDADLRAQMRMEIARLHNTLNSTVIYVTHDQVEAMTLADRIVVLRDGRIEQVGTPDELYENPANVFVAQFLGLPKMNLLPGRVTGKGTGSTLELSQESAMKPPRKLDLPPGEEVTVGVRPGDVKLVQPSAPEAVLTGEIDLVEYLGDELLAYIRLPDMNEPMLAKLEQGARAAAGQKTGITFDQKRMHLFAADGSRLAWQ